MKHCIYYVYINNEISFTMCINSEIACIMCINSEIACIMCRAVTVYARAYMQKRRLPKCAYARIKYANLTTNMHIALQICKKPAWICKLLGLYA